MRVHDPVCSMEVESPSDHRSEYLGTMYEFCSGVCKTKFDADLAKYLGGSSHVTAPEEASSGRTEKLQIPIIGMDWLLVLSLSKRECGSSRVFTAQLSTSPRRSSTSNTNLTRWG